MDRDQWVRRIMSLLSLLPIAGLIFVVLGTIYMGIATPTEAAAFGVTGALGIGIMVNADTIWRPVGAIFLKRTGLVALLPRDSQVQIRRSKLPAREEFNRVVSFSWKILQTSFLSTVRTTGMIFFSVLAAFTLSFAFARLGISQDIADAIIGLNLNAVTLVIVLVVFYLVLGTFMESFSMLVTTIPILVPTLQQAGVDLVWFGIIMVILIEAALISPPEGINLYVIHGVRQDITRELADADGTQAQQGTIVDLWIGVLPFMACMAVAVALIVTFPEIALWLPDAVKGERCPTC